MRIFMGLYEIAGYYANLKKGFDDLGVEADFVDLSAHRFKYGGDTRNVLVDLVRYLGMKRAATPRSNLLLKAWWISLYVLSRVPLILWATIKYDIFVFGYRSSFLWRFYDLPI